MATVDVGLIGSKYSELVEKLLRIGVGSLRELSDIVAGCVHEECVDDIARWRESLNIDLNYISRKLSERNISEIGDFLIELGKLATAVVSYLISSNLVVGGVDDVGRLAISDDLKWGVKVRRALHALTRLPQYLINASCTVYPRDPGVARALYLMGEALLRTLMGDPTGLDYYIASLLLIHGRVEAAKEYMGKVLGVGEAWLDRALAGCSTMVKAIEGKKTQHALTKCS